MDKLEISIGDMCVIFGPGPIDCMMGQLAKHSGAGKVIMVGTRDYRLELAQKLGADEILNVKEKDSRWYVESLRDGIWDMSGGDMVDKVLCATPSLQAAHQALKISGRGSTVVFFGLPGPDDILQVPFIQNLLFDKDIRFAFRSPFTWNSTLQALSGIVDTHSLTSHRFPLEQLIEGMDMVRERREKAQKALVELEN